MNAYTAIINLINGNLKDAKAGSKNIPAKEIICEAQGIGYNYNESLLMASYLKGTIDFQDYCDNMNNKY